MRRQRKEQARKDALRLFNEQLFCILYPTLHDFSRKYDELTPSEVYMEALSLSEFLMGCKRPDLMEDEVAEMLTEKYSTFETASESVRRSDEEAGRTSFLVLVTALYQMATIGKQEHTDRYKPCCELLARMTYNHPLLGKFMDGVRMTEDQEELQGRRVEIVNLMCHDDNETPDKFFSSFIACAKEYPDHVVESMLTVVSDFSDRNGCEYDGYVQVLRTELKTRVKNQREPRTINSERTYMAGATHNDYGKYLGLGSQMSNDKLLENYE